jgi:YD repeat-containing protein
MRARACHVSLVFTAALAVICACASDEKDLANSSNSSETTPKVRYAYDPLGRLVQAASSDGIGVQYSYDAVGNITSIRRLEAGALRIVDFSPPSGMVGSTVAVYGSGFSVTASENAVSVNGISAMVTSATATALTVNVPQGATTGKISVTSASGSTTSSAAFMVLSSSSAPGISGFTPTVATLGTVVSVTGVNFQVNPENDKVSVGGKLAKVVKDGSSPTGTLLKFTVPSTMASGKIEVTTPFGNALSTDELFTLPTGVNATDVEAIARIAVGGPPLSVTTTTAGKKIMLAFNAQLGQRLHLVAIGGTFTAGFSADVYGPTGAKLQTLNMTNNSVNDFSAPAVAGPHAIVVNPATTDKGSVQLSLVADVTGAIALDGSTAVSLSSAQNARLSFASPANTGHGLAVTGLAFTPSSGLPIPAMTVTLRAADGTSLATCSFPSTVSCDFDPASFVSAATYFLDFDPNALYAATFGAVLSADAAGSVALDAAPTTVTIARAGQNARYSFAGAAGQGVTVVLSGSTLDDGNPSTTSTTQVQVVRTNGSVLASNSFNNFSSGLALDATLPDTGSYAILIKPSGLDSGVVNLDVKTVATGALTLDGSTPVSLSAGRNGRFSFTAQAATGYGLALTNLIFTPSTSTPAPQVAVTLRKADGTTLSTCALTASNSCDLPPTSFATTSSYFLDVDPNGIVAASFDVVLSADLDGTIEVDAPAPTTVLFARAGQNARYRFNGSAGQLVKVVVSGNALDDGDPTTVNAAQLQVFKPSSPNTASTGSRGFNTLTPGFTLNLTLPETGTYAITIHPGGLDRGSLDLGVTHQ